MTGTSNHYKPHRRKEGYGVSHRSVRVRRNLGVCGGYCRLRLNCRLRPAVSSVDDSVTWTLLPHVLASTSVIASRAPGAAVESRSSTSSLFDLITELQNTDRSGPGRSPVSRQTAAATDRTANISSVWLANTASSIAQTTGNNVTYLNAARGRPLHSYR